MCIRRTYYIVDRSNQANVKIYLTSAFYASKIFVPFRVVDRLIITIRTFQIRYAFFRIVCL